MGENTVTNLAVSRDTWRGLHAQTHHLFQAIWTQMQRISTAHDTAHDDLHPDWHTLHDLLSLASVISAITSRHATIPIPGPDHDEDPPAEKYDPGPGPGHGLGCQCWDHAVGCTCDTCWSCPGTP